MVLADYRLVILSGESSKHATRDRFGQKHTHTADLAERERTGTHLVRLEKNARGTVCPASHFRPAMSSFDFRHESYATALFLWQRPRATSATSPSAMIPQSVSRYRGRQIVKSE